MPSRDVWSPGAGGVLGDILGAAIVGLALRADDVSPVYFSSPWITDLPIFANRFREFSALFPERADEDEIRLSDCLVRLARDREVRIITASTKESLAFLRDPRFGGIRLSSRLASSGYHEKGILGPSIYIEGSMNITYSGVYINKEKVTVHVGSDADAAARIAAAYLEFDRHWSNLHVGP